MSEFTKSAAVTAATSQATQRSIALRIAGVLGFVGLIAIGAHVQYRFEGTQVPVTLQTFFVLAAGAILGPVDCAAAVAIYVALGVLGVPLFANPKALGLSYLSGVTGGYLVGFFFAAILVGALVRRNSNAFFQAGAFFIAAISILVFGTLWLTVLTGSFEKAFVAGFLPFVFGDVVKAALAFGAYRACGAAYHRTFVRRKTTEN